MDLAERVKAARAAKGLTQAELADVAGISLRNVSKIELGQQPNLKLGTAEKIAVALGCQLDWLLLGKGDAPTGTEAA